MSDGRMLFERERRDLAEAVQLTYYRKNTNTAGGNFSFKVRDDTGKEYLIMTPTMMSEAYHGKLAANQILVVEPGTRKIIAGEGELTREINMHEAAYFANPEIKCVFHAHAPESMFWATSGLDMPNLTEATQKVKYIKVLPFEPNCSEELAEVVADEISQDRTLPKEYLLDSHGVLILTPGSTGMEALHKALSILDTVEWNAKIAYQQTIFQKLDLIDGYRSKGIKVGDLADILAHQPIFNGKIAEGKISD